MIPSGAGKWFPINRRHQRLATPAKDEQNTRMITCFQSIGVTKDWRLKVVRPWGLPLPRFQSIGVTKDWRPKILTRHIPSIISGFPINRRHQGLSTWVGPGMMKGKKWFPINRRHQRLVTRQATSTPNTPARTGFLINRRNQSLATWCTTFRP